MFLFIVLPIFFVAVFAGVESWLWKAIWIAVVGCVWYLSGPASMAVAAILIIGIGFKNAFKEIGGSKL